MASVSANGPQFSLPVHALGTAPRSDRQRARSRGMDAALVSYVRDIPHCGSIWKHVPEPDIWHAFTAFVGEGLPGFHDHHRDDHHDIILHTNTLL